VGNGGAPVGKPGKLPDGVGNGPVGHTGPLTGGQSETCRSTMGAARALRRISYVSVRRGQRSYPAAMRTMAVNFMMVSGCGMYVQKLDY
jgi:hypothetical protein